MPSRHAPLSRHHTNYFAVSRITPWKKGQSRHHANRLGYLLKMCSCKKENNGDVIQNTIKREDYKKIFFEKK